MSKTMEQSDEAAAAVVVGPRVAYEDLKARIAGVHYINAGDAVIRSGGPSSSPLHLLTICVLVVDNGFTVVGTSACAYPENYDKALGEQLAREDAERQLWGLLGFELKTRLTVEAEPAI